jgi:hypothetical protein
MPLPVLVAGGTPIGRLLGSLSALPATALGATAVRAALDTCGIAGEQVDAVIMGNVVQAGAGPNPARLANLGWTDIELTHPVYTGDTLYAESLRTAKRESGKRPGMGIISMFTRGLNQGDVVLSWNRSVMVPRSGHGIGEDYFPTAKAGPLQSQDV